MAIDVLNINIGKTLASKEVIDSQDSDSGIVNDIQDEENNKLVEGAKETQQIKEKTGAQSLSGTIQEMKKTLGSINILNEKGEITTQTLDQTTKNIESLVDNARKYINTNSDLLVKIVEIAKKIGGIFGINLGGLFKNTGIMAEINEMYSKKFSLSNDQRNTLGVVGNAYNPKETKESFNIIKGTKDGPVDHEILYNKDEIKSSITKNKDKFVRKDKDGKEYYDMDYKYLEENFPNEVKGLKTILCTENGLLVMRLEVNDDSKAKFGNIVDKFVDSDKTYDIMKTILKRNTDKDYKGDSIARLFGVVLMKGEYADESVRREEKGKNKKYINPNQEEKDVVINNPDGTLDLYGLKTKKNSKGEYTINYEGKDLPPFALKEGENEKDKAKEAILNYENTLHEKWFKPLLINNGVNVQKELREIFLGGGDKDFKSKIEGNDNPRYNYLVNNKKTLETLFNSRRGSLIKFLKGLDFDKTKTKPIIDALNGPTKSITVYNGEIIIKKNKATNDDAAENIKFPLLSNYKVGAKDEGIKSTDTKQNDLSAKNNEVSTGGKNTDKPKENKSEKVGSVGVDPEAVKTKEQVQQINKILEKTNCSIAIVENNRLNIKAGQKEILKQDSGDKIKGFDQSNNKLTINFEEPSLNKYTVSFTNIGKNTIVDYRNDGEKKHIIYNVDNNNSGTTTELKEGRETEQGKGLLDKSPKINKEIGEDKVLARINSLDFDYKFLVDNKDWFKKSGDNKPVINDEAGKKLKEVVANEVNNVLRSYSMTLEPDFLIWNDSVIFNDYIKQNSGTAKAIISDIDIFDIKNSIKVVDNLKVNTEGLGDNITGAYWDSRINLLKSPDLENVKRQSQLAPSINSIDFTKKGSDVFYKEKGEQAWSKIGDKNKYTIDMNKKEVGVFVPSNKIENNVKLVEPESSYSKIMNLRLSQLDIPRLEKNISIKPGDIVIKIQKDMSTLVLDFDKERSTYRILNKSLAINNLTKPYMVNDKIREITNEQMKDLIKSNSIFRQKITEKDITDWKEDKENEKKREADKMIIGGELKKNEKLINSYGLSIDNTDNRKISVPVGTNYNDFDEGYKVAAEKDLEKDFSNGEKGPFTKIFEIKEENGELTFKTVLENNKIETLQIKKTVVKNKEQDDNLTAGGSNVKKEKNETETTEQTLLRLKNEGTFVEDFEPGKNKNELSGFTSLQGINKPENFDNKKYYMISINSNLPLNDPRVKSEAGRIKRIAGFIPSDKKVGDIYYIEKYDTKEKVYKIKAFIEKRVEAIEKTDNLDNIQVIESKGKDLKSNLSSYNPGLGRSLVSIKDETTYVCVKNVVGQTESGALLLATENIKNKIKGNIIYFKKNLNNGNISIIAMGEKA